MLSALVAAFSAAGCTGAGMASEADPDAALRFPGSAPTLDALGGAVLAALTVGDRAALEGFRLTETEHNEVVWPELPASAPELNYPVDYAWQNIENRNRRGVDRLLPLFGGREPGFRSVECRGPTETFDSFEVATDCWVVFGLASEPRLLEARLFKDVLVRGGGYKIFRYYDEEPRGYTGSRGG
jgi:hypothetical protein